MKVRLSDDIKAGLVDNDKERTQKSRNYKNIHCSLPILAAVLNQLVYGDFSKRFFIDIASFHIVERYEKYFHT